MKQSQRDFFEEEEEEKRPVKKGRTDEDDVFIDEESGLFHVNEDNQPIHRITIRSVTSAIPSSRKEIEDNSEKIAGYVCLGIVIVLIFLLLSFMIYPVGWGPDAHPYMLQSNTTPINNYPTLNRYNQHP